MSKSNSWETALLSLVFNNANVNLIGDTTGLRGSSTAGSLYLSLHTSDPGESGLQNTNEVAYSGYARQAVTRDSSGFTVSGNTASLAANVDFPDCLNTPGVTVIYFGIGTAPTGGGSLLYSGTVSPPINMDFGVIPRLTTATVIVEE